MSNKPSPSFATVRQLPGGEMATMMIFGFEWCCCPYSGDAHHDPWGESRWASGVLGVVRSVSVRRIRTDPNDLFLVSWTSVPVEPQDDSDARPIM